MDWQGFLESAKANVGALATATPGTVGGYQALHAAGSKADLLGERTRELICIAVAVTTRCNSCIANHVQKAIALGVTRGEIAEAVGVAVAMNAGAALSYAGRAMDAHAALTNAA